MAIASWKTDSPLCSLHIHRSLYTFILRLKKKDICVFDCMCAYARRVKKRALNPWNWDLWVVVSLLVLCWEQDLVPLEERKCS